MKVRSWCILLILATAVAIGTGLYWMYSAMYPQREEAVVLRMAVPYSAGHPSTLAAERFAQRVAEESGGTLEIQVSPDGQLGDEQSAVEQLQYGGIALAILPTLALPEDSAVLETGTGENDYPGGVLRPLEGALDAHGLQLLAEYGPDYRCLANNRGVLRPGTGSLTLQAHKMPALSLLLEELGFQVAEEGGSGLDASLNYGDVDGVEMSLMELAFEGYGNLLPYITLFSGPLSPDVILASRAAMGGLSIQQQNVLRACAQESEEYQKEILPQYQGEAVQALAEQGARLLPEAAALAGPEDWQTLWPLYYGALRESSDEK